MATESFIHHFLGLKYHGADKYFICFLLVSSIVQVFIIFMIEEYMHDVVLYKLEIYVSIVALTGGV